MGATGLDSRRVTGENHDLPANQGTLFGRYTPVCPRPLNVHEVQSLARHRPAFVVDCIPCLNRWYWLRLASRRPELAPVLYPEHPQAVRVASYATLAVTHPGANALVKPPPPQNKLPVRTPLDVADAWALFSALVLAPVGIVSLILWVAGFWT